MDFFAALPPELVLAVSLHLDLSAIASCLLVSRHWRDLLSNLEPYWRQACAKLGLSESLIEELLTKHGSTKTVAFAASRQRQVLIESPHFTVKVTEGYPYNVHYVCNSMQGNTLVGTIYRDFKPCGIVIKTIQKSSARKTVIDPKFSMRAENRTYWARIVSNTLVHVTASGLWSMYDLACNGGLLAQWRGATIFDSEVKIGICETCRTICISKLVNNHTQPPYWDLRVLSPGENMDTHVSYKKPTIIRFKVDVDSDVKQATNWQKSVLIFPFTTDVNSRGRCLQHSILLQCGNTAYCYKLFSDNKDSNQNKLSYSPESNLSAQIETNAVLSGNYGLSTGMVLSADRELLGMVFQSQLIVWERRTSRLLSVAELELDTYIHEQIKLVALGRVHSLIGLEYTSSLRIVLTSTGQTIRDFSDFAKCHIPLVPPYIECLGALQDSWLSDVTLTPSASLPTLVYWNKTNRAVEGISFGRESEKMADEEIVPTKRRAWWKLW